MRPPGGCGSVLESIILAPLLRKTWVCADHVCFLANESPGVASLRSLLSRCNVGDSSSPQTAANRLRCCWTRLTGVKSRTPGSFSTRGAFLWVRFFTGTPFLEAGGWRPLFQVLMEANPMENWCFSSYIGCLNKMEAEQRGLLLPPWRVCGAGVIFTVLQSLAKSFCINIILLSFTGLECLVQYCRASRDEENVKICVDDGKCFISRSCVRTSHVGETDQQNLGAFSPGLSPWVACLGWFSIGFTVSRSLFWCRCESVMGQQGRERQ